MEEEAKDDDNMDDFQTDDKGEEGDGSDKEMGVDVEDGDGDSIKLQNWSAVCGFVSLKPNSRVSRGADWRAQHSTLFFRICDHLYAKMGQLLSSASCSIRGEHDMPVVEPVVVRTATSRRESSSVSYTGRRSHRGSIPSTSGGGYHEVGLDDDSARRELEGQR
ncbi:hypothetical protein FNV43_RR01722 [Rhamnella rubrinervis]|uniref:Uncharacterized protein n=1 Tax=Rhamnella rubrinervis TaxID=2594499 RepID=A0A8K0HSP7_9ROSA|nr:hypothetical protein FNV43_RR01722 [Rhamnella rubrinervis]